jgi:hypothetical protein
MEKSAGDGLICSDDLSSPAEENWKRQTLQTSALFVCFVTQCMQLHDFSGIEAG